MGRCFLHDPPLDVPGVELLDHMRTAHPLVWGSGPRRWPDGRIIVYSPTMVPGFLAPEEPRPKLKPGACPDPDVHGRHRWNHATEPGEDAWRVCEGRGCTFHEEGGYGFMWTCVSCRTGQP